MNTIITNLQDKTYVRAFGLMSPEEQECFEKAGKENCLIYIYHGAGWVKPTRALEFDPMRTYVIKPDYQPEPEFVDLEIILHNAPIYHKARVVKMLCVRIDEKTMYQLHELPSLPNFECFFYKDFSDTILQVNQICCVAGKIAEKRTVFARFRAS